MIKQRRKFNAQNVERFCALIAGGNSEQVSCAQVGITVETLVDWLENKPKFAQRYAKAKSDIQVLATERLLKFTGRDPRAAQYFHVQVNADFRRSPSNGGAAAEERPAKLDPVEHANRLREIFGVSAPAPVSTESNGPALAGACQDEDEANGMSVSESLAADEQAKAYGERVARKYAKNLSSVPAKGCSV